MASSEDVWTTPAIAPPDGQESDFNSPISHTWAPLFYGVTTVFMALAAACVFIKLYIRFCIHKRPGLDDLCIAFALAFQVSWTAVSDNIIAQGASRHEWDMSLGQFGQVMDVESDLNILQMPTYMFTKLALLLLYYRLFSAKAAFKWAVLTGCAVVTSVYFALMFIFIFTTKLDDLIMAAYGLACLNLITDVYLWLLPLAAIGSLQLPWDRKVGVAGLFSAGALACAMSALSLYNRFSVDYSTLADWTYDYARCNAIIAVEIYVGIIVGCVPVFPSLLRTNSVGGSFSKAVRVLRQRVGGSDGSRATCGSHAVNSGKGTTVTSSTVTRVSRGDMYLGPEVDGQHQHQHQHQHEMQPLEDAEFGDIERAATPGYHRPSLDPSSESSSVFPLDSLYAPSIDSEAGEGGGHIWSAASVSPV